MILFIRCVHVLLVLFAAVSCQSNTADNANTQSWKALYDRGLQAVKSEQDVKNVLPDAERAFEIAASEFGPDDKRTLWSLSNLAALYEYDGQYAKAEELHKEALRRRQDTLGHSDEDTLISLNGLARLYHKQGRFADAEQTFTQALKLRRATLGDAHKDTLATMNNLASTLSEQGRYGESEELQDDVLGLKEEKLGADHRETLTTRNNLGIVYYRQRRFEETESIWRDVLELRRETLGEAHPQTLNSYNNLARLYSDEERYAEAEPLYLKAVQILGGALGNDHPQTLNSQTNLARLYRDQGRLEQAEALYEQTVRTQTETLGEQHFRTLKTLNDLAGLYHIQGHYSKAASLYEKTLALRRAALGNTHADTLRTQLGFVYPLTQLRRMSEAVVQLRENQSDRLIYAESELASTQALGTRSRLLQGQGSFQDVVLSLALQEPSVDILNLASDVILSWKQVQGAKEVLLAHLLRTEPDPKVQDLASQVAALRARLARLAQSTDPNEDPTAVLMELEAKELALARLSDRFKRRKAVQRASIKRLQAVLPERSGVIEFRQYRPVDFGTGEEGDPHFAALLVRPDQPPLLIDAGPVEEAEKRLQTLHSDQVSARADQAAEALHKQLFSGFGDELDALDKLYIAPDGLLHLVPFDRLRLTDGRYWGEHQALRFLSTGRDLLIASASNQTVEGLLALGGVDFGSQERVDAEAPLLTSLDRRKVEATRGQVRSIFEAFEPLEASGDEVVRIERIYRELRPDDPVTVWTGKNASETSLKTLNGLKHPPRVLHVATHGFYLPTSLQTLARPQLYSGLVMAGANNHLNLDDDEAAAQAEDGILYSLEAQDLNLEGTELVVLSACDTGKGVVDYSEGIVGMAQALRIAGAKQILMTLWPVLDKPTAAFMESFYENWLTHPNQDPAVALDATKEAFRQHENSAYRKPQIWAPFILIGA